MRVRRIRALALAVVLTVGGSGASLAQEQGGLPQYVGIPADLMNTVYAQQRRSQWCWAACTQMVLQRYGVAVQQEDVVRRTYGADPSGKLPDSQANADTMTKNLNNWGIDAAGKHYLLTASGWPGAPTPAMLIAELKAGHPLILGCRAGFGGHAVVCTGASYVAAPNPYGEAAPVIRSVIIRNPMPVTFFTNLWNPAGKGRQEYTWDQFSKVIMAHWSIRALAQGSVTQRVDTSGAHQLVGTKPGAESVTSLPRPGRTMLPTPFSGPPKVEPAEPAAAAAPDVRLTESDVHWTEEDSQPAVTFALTYKNEGQEARSCRVAVDVELASRETDGFERTFRTKTFDFDLRPGRSYTIKGSLDAYQDLAVHPRLSLRLSLKP